MKRYIPLALLAGCMAFTSCYDSVLDYDGNANEVNNGGNSSSEGTLSSADQAVGFLRQAQMLVIDAREHKYQFQCSFIGDDPVGYV